MTATSARPVQPEVVLRPAVPADVGAMAAVHVAARQHGQMPDSLHPEGEVRQWLADQLAAGDEAWVAEAGGEVGGYARFTDTWLDDLYVAPGHARQGLGSALLDLVKARRPGGFELWVFEMNAPARAFYRRHGLVEVECTDGTANEEREPDIRVAWPGARSGRDGGDGRLSAVLSRIVPRGRLG